MATTVADTDTTTTAELAAAMSHFQSLFDWAWLDQLQPLGPATIYTASVTTHLMLYQRLQANASLQEAVAELLRRPDILPNNKRVREGMLSASTGSYCVARQRLALTVTEQLCDRLTEQLVHATPPAFGSRRVILLDGTTMTLAHHPELLAAFPPMRNQHGLSHWPIVRLVVAHDLSSGCAWRPEFGPMMGSKGSDEVSLALRLLPRLPPRSLLMADRNFGIFAFVYAAFQAGHDTVTRLTVTRFEALKRKAQPVGPGRWRCDWKPTPADRKKHPQWPAKACVSLSLQAQKLPSGEWLYLATTADAEADAWATLYLGRGHVETDIRNVKIMLQMEASRVESVALWTKELNLGYVAHNLVIQTRRLAAEQIRVEPRRLSFAGVASLVRQILLTATCATAAEWEELLRRVLRWSGQRKLPKRPHPRSYPRTVLPRRRKHPVQSKPPAKPPDPPLATPEVLDNALPKETK